MIKSLEEQKLELSRTAFGEICSFLTRLAERKEAVPIYAANSAADSGIMARLIEFASKTAEALQPATEEG